MARPMTWLTSMMLIVIFAVLASAQQPLQSPNNEQPALQPESEELTPLSEEETAGPRRVTLQDEEILPGPNDQGQDLVRNRRTFGFFKGYHHGYYRPRYYYSSWGPRYYSYYRPYYYNSHYW